MSWDSNYLQREAWRLQTAENSARLAFAWGVSSTSGVGSLSHEDVVDFGLTFIEQPMFSYGTVLKSRIDFEDDVDGTSFAMPTSTGFVFSWKLDGRGFYTGAHVGITVTGGTLDVELDHHFTFMGTAMKDVANGDLQDLLTGSP